MKKDNKPFTMNKKEDKKNPKKEVLNLDDILVDKSNKTMILDLNELEFDEQTQDISDQLQEVSKSASSIIIDESSELELDDLLEEKTIDNFKNFNNSENKTVVISIEDIIEADTNVETDSLIEGDDILQETFDGLKTTSNTFIKNIDFKMSNNLQSSDEVSKEEYKVKDNITPVNVSVEASSEKLLDFLIYGRHNDFEKELTLLQEHFDNNTVDLIKYMFEFYVKKDD